MPEPLPDVRNDPIFIDLFREVLRTASILEASRNAGRETSLAQKQLDQATEDLVFYLNVRLAIVAYSTANHQQSNQASSEEGDEHSNQESNEQSNQTSSEHSNAPSRQEEHGSS